MSVTKTAPAQVARDDSKRTPATPRVLDTAELAVATGGGVVVSSRAPLIILGY